jgi:hypothetical protein
MSRPPIPWPRSTGYWLGDRWIEPGAIVDLKPGEQVLWRGTRAIAIRPRRHTFRRNLRYWLLPRWRDWLRGAYPAAMHGGLDL